MTDILQILRDYGLLLLVGQYPNGPLGGLAITFALAVLGILLAFPLGVLLALGRISPFGLFSWPSTVIVYVARGVPLIMLIFWMYYFLPVATGRPVSGFSTMVATLVVYQASYIAEIVRAGIEGLPKGQMEAGRSLGLSYFQTMRKVILPQALYNMVPTLLSQFISTIKETSLGYVIGVNELTFAANQINTTLLTKPFQVFAILAAVYFALCFSLTLITHQLERRVTARRVGAPTRGVPQAQPVVVIASE